jgi:hypothetical protein
MGKLNGAGGFADHALGKSEALVVFALTGAAGAVGHFAKSSRQF